jgi:hypothetical protein
MGFSVEKAKKKQHKLRLLITGLSGSGKTYGALKLAKGMGLCNHGQTVVIDTENKSSALYGEEFEFDMLELEAPYSPERYLEAVEYAEGLGYKLIIIDSISHEWDFANEAANNMVGKNTIKNWGDYKTKRHTKLVQKILRPKTHLICTGRVKTAYEEVEEDGRKKMKKIGTKLKQEDGLDYEYDIVLDLDRNHNFVCSKTRARCLESLDPAPLTEEVGTRILEWLNSGQAEKKVKDEVAVELSEYGKKIFVVINDATQANIKDIGTRLKDKEVKAQLSAAELKHLNSVYKLKVEQVSAEF